MKLILLLLAICTFAHAEPKTFEVTSEVKYDSITMPDSLVTFVGIPVHESPSIAFSVNDSIGTLLELKFNGEIYWRNRLVTTDSTLVKALTDAVQNIRCSSCAYKELTLEKK